ncbi:DNA internalization-related competence protein ComEC/Rec2 [Lactobacillus sp. DCY120]|uniref:DNA internalization-related competence protein ComEC/Rec2 n=1 Tax=Bombilactobacillus apium TaxID=2675299 RepID=A0A850R5A0_9LACO|nr:DNA internalization-related competence protein ComEC/Rec2 [Bombilactobacillus apium]NVY95715.1 DNA internalization-related competence protein ComEC/Rec2 [Bombilactobacillus apium]
MFEPGWYIFVALALQLAITFWTGTNRWLWLGLFLGLIVVVLRAHQVFCFLVMGGCFWGGQLLTFPQPPKPPLVQEVRVAADQIKIHDQWLSGQGKLADGREILWGGPLPAHFRPSGQTLIIRGDFTTERITPATNPGEFDFRKYYHYQRIDFRATGTKLSCRVATQMTGLELLHSWRWHCLQFLEKFPHWLRINAASLLLGEFDNQETQLRQGLTNLGIIHIFSISGLHVYLLIAWLKKIASRLRYPVEYLERGLLLVLPLLGVLAGGGVGIWRACGLALLQILRRQLAWKLSRHDCFGLVLLGQTLFEPYVLFSLAGQLSYLLSYGLLVIKVPRAWQRSLLINFLSIPILIYHNFSFSWLTVGANLLITPIFESLIIPVTVGTLLLQPFPQSLSFLEQCFQLIYHPIQDLAAASWSQITIGQVNIVLILFLLGLTLVWLQLFPKPLWCLILILYLCIWAGNRYPLQGEVSIIDIGQGDSILISSPYHRYTCLIDTGGKLNFGHRNPDNNRVEQITIPYLRHQGITHLDAVFLSHQDADHIGDLGVLLRNFPVRKVYFAAGMERNKAVGRQLRPFIHRVKYSKLRLNNQKKVAPQLNFRVVWPRTLSQGRNEDSLSLLWTIGPTSWLFTGDLNRVNERRLFRSPVKLDYLKAGHHGSKTASDPQFLAASHPRLVLISAGRNNRYGHPNQETLANLNRLGIPYWNTAEHGMLTYRYLPEKSGHWQLFYKGKLKS